MAGYYSLTFLLTKNWEEIGHNHFDLKNVSSRAMKDIIISHVFVIIMGNNTVYSPFWACEKEIPAVTL